MKIIKREVQMPNSDMFSIVASNNDGFKLTIISSEGYITFENKEELKELFKAFADSYFNIYNSYLIKISNDSKENF